MQEPLRALIEQQGVILTREIAVEPTVLQDI